MQYIAPFIFLLRKGSRLTTAMEQVIVAKRSASVTVPGLPQAVVEAGLEAQGMSLAYRDNHPSVA